MLLYVCLSCVHRAFYLDVFHKYTQSLLYCYVTDNKLIKNPDTMTNVRIPRCPSIVSLLFLLYGNSFHIYISILQFSISGENETLTTFAIKPMMPSNLADYYTYAGSLTTPPCSEVVVWNIFEETVKISEKQVIYELRLLHI